MKRTLTILAASAAILSAVSCEKNQTPVLNGVAMEEVSIEAGISGTKLAINGLKVNWTADDVISICTREKGLPTNLGSKFTSDLASESANAVFSGVLPDTLTHIYAIYPYSTIDHWNKGAGVPQVYIGLKTTQKAVKNGIDPAAAIMYASALKGEPLTFHVVNSYIKFTIGADSPKVTSVSVKEANRSWICLDLAKAGAPLGGDVNPTIKDVTLTSSSVLEAGDYYIAVLAEKYSDGLAIVFTLEDGTTIAKRTPAITLNRNTIYPIGTVKASAPVVSAFKIGDLYTEGDNKAIVYSIDETGTIATVISVDRKMLHYAESEDNIGATSQSSGADNMATLKAYKEANATASFPAYEYCAAKGEGWYLPALKEFQSLICAYEEVASWNDAVAHRNTSSALTDDVKAKRAIFDAYLTSNGGEAMNAGDPTGNGDHYWTSTEYSSTSSYPGCAYQVRTGKLYILQGSDAAKKTRNGYVRCAKKITK